MTPVEIFGRADAACDAWTAVAVAKREAELACAVALQDGDAEALLKRAMQLEG